MIYIHKLFGASDFMYMLYPGSCMHNSKIKIDEFRIFFLIIFRANFYTYF